MQQLIAFISFFNLAINIFTKNLFSDNSKKKIFLFQTIASFVVTVFGVYFCKNEDHFIILLNNIGFLHFGQTKIGNIMSFLTSFIMLLTAIELLNSKKYDSSGSYINLILTLNIALMMCFFSLDILSFFIFFEASIIPIFFIILNYGGESKIKAAKTFLTYSIAGSAMFLIVIIYLSTHFHTFLPSEITPLLQKSFMISEDTKIILSFLAVIAFFVKIPVFPFHTWLPLAHVQAPTSGSILLAGVLIKLGGFGLIQYVVPIFTPQLKQFSNFYIYAGIFSLIYGSVICFAQTDLKKMIAYSSIAHMSYVIFGIFSFDENGLKAATFQMVSHGIISASLFFLIDVIYSRYKTRNIEHFGNLYTAVPHYAKFLLLMVFASAGLPGTVGFIGEFLNILAIGSMKNITTLIFASSGALFGATYMLYFSYKVLYSNPENQKIQPSNLSFWEIIFLVLASIAVFLFGIMPNIILNVI